MAESIGDVPALLALWDEEKNGEPAAKVLVGYKTHWWKCPEGHSFQRQSKTLKRKPECPTCALGGQSFAGTYPHLASRWDAEKNDVGPEVVSPAHTAEVWWRCEEGHSFARSPLSMGQDDSCPHCALAADSLAARFPEIAKEWHPHRNGEMTAAQVEPDHMMTAWWVCSKGHEFQAAVRSRTTSRGRCPQCFGTWTVETIRSFVASLLGHLDALTPSELFALAMQAGALRGGGKDFVKALTTGRFPKEELEKFVQDKPSLVDEFANHDDFSLEIQEAKQAAAKALEADDPFALPEAPDADYQDIMGWLDRLENGAMGDGLRHRARRARGRGAGRRDLLSVADGVELHGLHPGGAPVSGAGWSHPHLGARRTHGGCGGVL